MKNIFKSVCIAVLAVAGGLPSRAVTNAVISSEWMQVLIEEARTNHPSLKANQAQIKASKADVAAVRVWETPSATVGGMIASRSRRKEDGDVMIGVEQMLPLFGKAQSNRRLAEAKVTQSEIEHDERFQVLRKNMAQAAVRLGLADAELTLGEEDVSWFGATVDGVIQRYASGVGASQSEVLRMRAELARRKDQIVTLGNQRKVAAALLNRWVGRPIESDWPVLSFPAKMPKVTYSESLVGMAVRFEPKLKLLRQLTNTAHHQVESVRRQRRPDVSLGVESRSFSGNGSMREGAVIVKFTMPWVHKEKFEQEIEREKARQEAVGHELESSTLEVREEIRLLTLRIDDGRREAEVYRHQVIPHAEQALESALIGYQTHREGLRDVLEARRLLVEARLMVLRAVAMQWDAMMELALCCGIGDFERLELINESEEIKP